MITLLKLLLARREILTGRASYSYQEVLNFLGWRDTKKSRNDIRDSVDINFLQSFNLWVDVSGVHTPMDYLRRLRILTAYEFFTDADESETRSERGLYRGDFSIDFNLDFIRSLRERSLLGLDWNLVIEVTRIHELESLSEEPI